MGWRSALAHRNNEAVNGRVHTLGGIIDGELWYISVSEMSARVNLSTRCKFAPEFGKLVFALEVDGVDHQTCRLPSGP